MKPGTKMLLMTDRDIGKRHGRKERHEDYDWHDDVESSLYKRDKRGRFRSDMDDYDTEPEMRGYPNRPFPVYEGGRSNMHPIGFDTRGSEIRTNYRTNATHTTGHETEHHSREMHPGGARSYSDKLTPEMAEEWTTMMHNEDGSSGAHWNMEQVKQLMAQKGIKHDLAEFYAVINAIYSDYCHVLKRFNVNNIDMYVALAKAWLDDADAVENKAAAYFENVVKSD